MAEKDEIDAITTWTPEEIAAVKAALDATPVVFDASDATWGEGTYTAGPFGEGS